MVSVDDEILTTCIGAAIGQAGDVYVLTNQYDGESIDSFVYRAKRFSTGESDVIFDAPEWFTSVYLSEAGVVYLGGDDGAIVAKVGTGWSRVFDSPGDQLSFVSGSGDDIYACGDNGLICYTAHRQWYSFREAGGTQFYGVARTGDHEFWAVGQGGKCFKLDNGQWQQIELPVNSQLNYIARHGDDLMIVGDNGTFITGSGDRWHLHDVPPDLDLYMFTEYKGEVLVAAGQDGIYAYRNEVLEPYKTTSAVTFIRAYGKGLMACGGNKVGLFNGRGWSGMAF